jgi:alpha,alpha-trehalase
MTLEFPLCVLSEYALLADGERGILVGPRGEFAWMCAPRWDSDAVFSTLVGGPGVYAVTPADPSFVWGGYYEPGTLIWRSRWVTTAQEIECREALSLPGDPHTAVALRRVLAIDGDTQVRVFFDPRAGFGRHRPSQVSRRNGVWTARCGPLFLRWSGIPATARRRGAGLHAMITVPAGGHHDLVLEISDRPLAGAPADPGLAWRATETAWEQAVPRLPGAIADRDACHAYAVMRGLTSSGGGMAAAATMSLPERAQEGRNYDYRYAWIRDQCIAGQAVAAAGPYPLLDSAVGFVTERILADGPQLKPAYAVGGGPVPEERELPLPGYPGSTAKAGNWVSKQFQLDAFGETLMPGTTGWTATTGGPWRSPSRRSGNGTAIPTPGSGNWASTAGRIPG